MAGMCGDRKVQEISGESLTYSRGDNMRMNKKLIKGIKDYILKDENKEEITGELKRYKNSFPSVMDYNWYKYGNILPYYFQLRNFYQSIGVKASESDTILQEHFEKHIRYAIDEILTENN